ncbi:MAG TPA: type II toxin-antitoxin system mRNA interferase toxin, RelE/StbE family [Melioribacteraceae bacterium]|nr:type II toxin-antitoxin system mRNA interferase toxin, RelE/StbE family [Melioribacteraceae bacterium]
MIVLNWSSSFKRAFKKIIKYQPDLQDRIINTLKFLEADPFEPSLKTHKLKGLLEGVYACSVTREVRIVFDLIHNPETGLSEILLINIGSHDEVY